MWTIITRLCRIGRFLATKTSILTLLLIVLMAIVFLVVGYYATGFWRYLCQTLALLLLPVSFVVLLDRIMLRDELLRIVETQIDQRLYKNLAKHGVQELYPRFSHDRIFDEAKQGGEIKILDTYIPTFDNYRPAMERALRRKYKMKFLIMDKDHGYAKARADEIRFSESKFKGGIQSYLESIATTATENRAENLVEVRLYDNLPGIPLYIIKNQKQTKLYFSLFLGKASINLPHFEVVKTEGAEETFNMFDDYFHKKWKRHFNKKVKLRNYSGS